MRCQERPNCEQRVSPRLTCKRKAAPLGAWTHGSDWSRATTSTSVGCGPRPVRADRPPPLPRRGPSSGSPWRRRSEASSARRCPSPVWPPHIRVITRLRPLHTDEPRMTAAHTAQHTPPLGCPGTARSVPATPALGIRPRASWYPSRCLLASVPVPLGIRPRASWHPSRCPSPRLGPVVTGGVRPRAASGAGAPPSGSWGNLARRSITLVPGVRGRCDNAARCPARRRVRGTPRDDRC